jgi:hypothetical protein
MKRRLCLATMVALLLSVASVPGAAADPLGTDRPFNGVATGELTWDGSNPIDCDEPFFETTFGALDGTTSHLGAVSVSMMHCPTYIGSSDGQMLLIAANGDELRGIYWGTTDYFPPDLGGWILGTAFITFDSGAGRFADATGIATGHLAVRFDGFDDTEWPAVLSWDGTISY